MDEPRMLSAESHLNPDSDDLDIGVRFQGLDDHVNVVIVDVVVVIDEDEESSPRESHQSISFLTRGQRPVIPFETDLNLFLESITSNLIPEFPANLIELRSSIFECRNEDTQKHLVS